MKYCKAWNNCPLEIDPVFKETKFVETKFVRDSRVWPKAVVDDAVDRSINELLKESFPEDPTDQAPEVKLVKNLQSQTVVHANVDPIWIALGVVCLLFLILINSISQRLNSLESWLRGRMSN